MTLSTETFAAAESDNDACTRDASMDDSVSSNSAHGLTLVSASAGSGKTYRLSQEVSGGLAAVANGIAPQGLVAVTYTTKAQAELESRLRRDLVRRGMYTRAESLPLAYLGTVHAVCLRLVKEFALDAGLSPSVDGLPQEAARRLLQEALEWAVPQDLRNRVEEVAKNLALNYDARVRRFDWILPVERIMTLARNNRIAPDALPDMAERSWRELQSVMGPPLSDSQELEAQLLRDIDHAINAIEQLADGQQNTNAALKALKDCRRLLKRGELAWGDWNKLTKLTPGKKALPLIASVTTTASQYIWHPRLHAELRLACELVFSVASIGLSAYAAWKEQRGLVDYVDMIDHALSLLEVEDVRAELATRLQLLVVDEFQDSSPVQLALFSRLHALCGRSLWVGDRKQCIFEYAGADPSLMEAVSHWVQERGGQTEVLGNNYRSRREIVNLVSALFSRAFATHGHAPEEVITEAASNASQVDHPLPPVGVWWVDNQHHNDAIAEGIQRLLADPTATPVWDSTSQSRRPLRASDIAVLVATNAHAEKVATALAQRGVKAALPRTGLMKTPEGTLLTCALRYLADRHDTLASAELEALTGLPDGDHEVWLARRVAAHDAKDFGASGDAMRALDKLRPRLPQMAPSEVVDQVLATLDVAHLAWRWPDPKQRIANLDALRGLVTAYESRATYLREAASLEGLLRYFDETQIAIKQQDEERASDEQHVVGLGDAVVLSTYHKSKGLEWPVVVLADLDRESRRDVFDVHPETDRVSFDADDPLGKRWIRYWPWPLAAQRNAPLRDRAEASNVGKRLAQRESRERVRLLYVGFTRAKDHLVIAIPVNKKGERKSAWLDELRDAQGPLLELPEPDATAATLRVRGTQTDKGEFKTRVWQLSGSETVMPPSTDAARYWYETPTSRRVGVTATSPESPLRYVINPSEAVESGLALPSAKVVSSERLSHRLPFESPKGKTWDEVGNAIHAFLAADEAYLEPAERHALAGRILTASSLDGAFTSEALLAASNALRAFVTQRWPNAKWYREVPVAAVIDTPAGARAVQGTIDLWLETEDGGIVIDHKSFPGASAQWHEQALKHAPQLFTYGLALRAAGKRVLGYFVHFVIGGGVVEVGEC